MIPYRTASPIDEPTVKWYKHFWFRLLVEYIFTSIFILVSLFILDKLLGLPNFPGMIVAAFLNTYQFANLYWKRQK